MECGSAVDRSESEAEGEGCLGEVPGFVEQARYAPDRGQSGLEGSLQPGGDRGGELVRACGEGADGSCFVLLSDLVIDTMSMMGSQQACSGKKKLHRVRRRAQSQPPSPHLFWWASSSC
ncbi:hypothetical protein SFUMM280S_04563 [Streptomyces fumanus]